jgi:tRNA(Ile)-lysidine synthase
MKSIEEKVLRFIDEKKIISANDKILVALSGGADSVFLIHFLNRYSKRFRFSLGALHINHGLRGKEADKDEKFCMELTSKLNIEFYSVKKNVETFARKSGLSLEEAGRMIRYKEFEKIAGNFGFNKIATAHNSDDNAETILLNLIKGTGLNGISGIPFQRGNIIRPVLVLSKKEIIDYLHSAKKDYCTDKSNLDDSYERNFLRNRIIPLITERLNPSFQNSVFKSAEVFKELNSFIRKKVESIYDDILIKDKETTGISLNKLSLIEKELWGEILRTIFEKEFNTTLSFDENKKIFSLIENQSGKSVNLTRGLKAFKERGRIVFSAYTKTDFKPLKLKPGESVKINDKSISIKSVKQGRIKKHNSTTEFINGDIVKNTFILRRWKNGDRFIPLGMKGSKKLSDFLNEQKLPSFKKKEQLILTNDKKIVWVVGVRLDDRFKVLPDTKKIYKIWLS